MAGLPGGLWTIDDGLQPLPSLGAPRFMASVVRSAGEGHAGRPSDHRQHDGEGASLGGRWKRGAETQAIGRSRGGRTTKVHAVVDGSGRPIAIEVSPGHRGDVRLAWALFEPLPPARICAADGAYDSDSFRQFLIDRGTTPVIPNNPTRKRLHPFDEDAYKQRNLIERMFCRLKDWRRIATRYDKLATNFHAAVPSLLPSSGGPN
jgi:transposase